MNILLYITIFVIGMIFGALTTLLCRIKLKQKVTIVKPYILRATLSGIIFVLFALSINLNQNILEKLNSILHFLQDYIPPLQSRQLCLDTGVLVGELTPPINKELAKIETSRERGR